MPKGYPRFKKAASGAVAVITQVTPTEVVDAEYAAEAAPELPRGWAKGAHLNVRNVGHEYRITLFPEEFDPLQPERCLRFTSPVECQNFVSSWYQRTSNDPRAR